ncbi:MAG: stalk domain-containing protein, partial [Candidatus Nanoarchaeia archaeon]|nr:stalk domain-containing protein [Candidatus Jingweiarchaeum tengchongense]
PSKWSFDGGITWNDVLLNPPAGNMLTTRIIVVDSVWYFNSWNTIWKTEDFVTYEKVVELNKTIDDFWTNGEIYFIGFRPGIDSEDQCLYVSYNKGKTWKNLSKSIRKALGNDYPYYLGASKISFYPKNSLSSFCSVLFVSVNATNMLVSFDEGDTFLITKNIALPLKLGNKLIARGLLENGEPDKKLYESIDNGLTWQIINNNFDYLKERGAHCLLEYDDQYNIIYLVDSIKGIYYSPNQGKTWVPYISNNLLSKYQVPIRLKICQDKLFVVINDDSFYANKIISKYPIIIIMHIGNTIFTVNDIIKVLDSPPIIKNNRTLVPIRVVVEALGGTIYWDSFLKKVTVLLKNNIVELWIGKSIAKINGISVPIDPNNPKVVPEIINSRTMIPLRFVVESLGCNVQWDDNTQTITIIY